MPNINIDDAYILGETGAQVDKVTGLFTKDEDTTSGEKAFAQLNIGTAGSNRNLLDNPWFTVNQRGWTNGTASNVYTVDRWKTSSGSSYSVTVNSDGTLTVTGLFYQKFEPHFISGQIVTISYMDGNGNVTSKTGTIGTLEGYAVGNAAFGLYYRPSTGICDFQIQASNLTLRACKCELGSVSTLANDAPSDYYKELDKCQWYFERIKAGNTYADFGIGVALSTTNAAFLVNMHPKRNNQYTVVTSGVFGATPGGTITSLVVDRAASNGVLNLYATGTFVANSPYVLRSANDANVYIDINNDL